MNPDEIKRIVLDQLGNIAPEMDPQSVRPKADLREQLDLDSMDMLNFVIGLHKALGIDIPESDYAKLATLDGCIDYLGAALGRVGR